MSENEDFDPEEIVKGDLESNFDAALDYVNICGKEVSYPLTLKKLGKDFTFPKSVGRASNRGRLLYKKNLREKKISSLLVGDDFLGDLEFEICGVGFDTNIDIIRDVFGTPTEDNGEAELKYYKNGNNRKYSIAFTVFGVTDTGGPFSISIDYNHKEDK